MVASLATPIALFVGNNPLVAMNLPQANSANANPASPNGTINQGLFGDSYQGTFELEFAPSNKDDDKPFAVRMQYTRASVNNLD